MKLVLGQGAHAVRKPCVPCLLRWHPGSALYCCWCTESGKARLYSYLFILIGLYAPPGPFGGVSWRMGGVRLM